MKVKALTAVACAWLSFGVRAQEAPSEPHAIVRASAAEAVRTALDANLPSVTLVPATLDERLRLPACGAKLGTYVPELRANQARLLVRVSCASPAWYLNVPVEIRRTHDVLVLKRAIGRGQAVEADVQKRELPGLASPFVASVAELAGRLTRRAVPAGAALPADALSAALL